MDIFNHFSVDAILATHKRYQPDQLIRLLPGKPTNEFWKNYCYKSDNNDNLPRIAEKVKNDSIIPIIIYITIPYPSNIELDTPYSEDFICKIVNIITNSIKKIIGIEDDNETLVSVALNSIAYKKNKDNVYTLCIQYPLCRMTVSEQKMFLRPLIIKQLKHDNILDLLPIKTKLVWESLIDIDIFSQGIPLYNKKYLFSETWFNSLGEILSFPENVQELFLPGKHKDTMIGLQITDHTNIMFWKPLILSMGFEGGSIYVPITVQGGNTSDNVQSSNLPEEQIFTEELLDMIALHRYKENSYRKKIGMSLYNIYKGENKGLELWWNQIQKVDSIKLSKKEYSIEDEIRDEYDSFSNNNPRTDITLEDYACEDNPTRYYEWYRKTCDKYMDLSLYPEHLESETGNSRLKYSSKNVVTQGSIARAFYMKNRRKLTFIDGKWYLFNGTYLEIIKTGPHAEVSDFKNDYMQYQSLIVQARNNEEDSYKKIQLTNMVTEINNVIKNLDTRSHINGIVSFLENIIARRTRKTKDNYDYKCFATAKTWILESRDKDDNGIPQPMLVRRGTIEDFCTKRSSITYNTSYDINSYWVKKSYEIDKQNFGGDIDMVNFFQEIYSKALRRTNGDKRGLNWVGPPGTSKTTVKKELSLLYGSYSFTPQSTILNGERTKSNNATPENALSNDCCVIFVEEPEPTFKINEGWYCEKTGGSESHTRLLNDNGSVSESTAQLSIICNDPIPLSPKAQIKVRHLILPFIARYIPEEGQPEIGLYLPKTEEERKKLHIYKKLEMRNILPNLAMGRLWRFVQCHGIIDFDDSVRIPKLIRTSTHKYWNRYDHYTLFVNKHIIKINKEASLKNPVTIDILYSIFKDFYISLQKGQYVPDRNTFISAMNGIIGTPNDDDIYENFSIKHDSYINFRDEMLYSTNNDKVSLSIRRLRKEFNLWHENNDKYSRLHSPNIFLIFMLSSIGRECYNPTSKSFMGWQIKPFDPEDL